MKEGDVIIFFCGSKRNERKSWDYYFIGVGTVAGIVENRKLLWTKPAYAAYRTFYNILVDSDGKQFETFHPFHKDWELRAKAPYIVFDPVQSVFNLDSPHLVATWNGDGLQEIWRRDRQTRAIEQLLFVEARHKTPTSHIENWLRTRQAQPSIGWKEGTARVVPFWI